MIAMAHHQPVLLKREVLAVRIPSGAPIKLPEGEEVTITQSLGGTYTVAFSGGMARIEAGDGDALGMEPGPAPADPAAAAPASPASEEDFKNRLWEQLRTVYDPEIPVNIVDLGLVYSLDLSESDGKRAARVKMTLTAPGCGMGPTIAADAKYKCLLVPGIDEAEVDLVWDPPWNQDMITEPGRMKLGLI